VRCSGSIRSAIADSDRFTWGAVAVWTWLRRRRRSAAASLGTDGDRQRGEPDAEGVFRNRTASPYFAAALAAAGEGLAVVTSRLSRGKVKYRISVERLPSVSS